MDILYPSGENARNSNCFRAIAHKITGLPNRCVFKIVKRDTLPRGSNIISSRLVLGLKDLNKMNQKYKERLYIHGHHEKEKYSI